ncbi:60S ribosomal protein L21 [Plecturocebus cupreus]
MGTVQKGMPQKCYHGKTERVYNVTQLAVCIDLNKLKARCLPRELILLKHIKGNGQKKKGAKGKGFWVQLKHQPTPPREACFVRTNGKKPELMEPVPCAFTA